MITATKFTIKKNYCDYQTGPGGGLRLRMLMDDLQGIAQLHADSLGFGSKFCHENKIGWALTNYIVDIIETPTFGEEMTITTWPSGVSAIRALRDFEIKGGDGRLMVRATTQWVMLDITTRRLTKIPKMVADYDVFPSRALDVEFEKIDDFEIADTPKTFPVLFDDIDSNGHVNNTSYTVWATESMGYEFLASNTLRELKINFKKEVAPGTDSVIAYHKAERRHPCEGRDPLCQSVTESRHMIQTNGQTNAVAVCTWAAVPRP